MCAHQLPCPTTDSADREAARRAAAPCPEQGRSPLRKGVLRFEDTEDLLPDGRVIAPHRLAAAA